MGVLHCNTEKVDKIIAAIIVKSRIKFYFLLRLCQQKLVRQVISMLHLKSFGATCVAAKLREKLHDKLPSVTATLGKLTIDFVGKRREGHATEF